MSDIKKVEVKKVEHPDYKEGSRGYTNVTKEPDHEIITTGGLIQKNGVVSAPVKK